ncbi:MAG: hypothetical protein K6D02_06695 [Lachnospiraceae bacterium]|nr:hypothetical protein [Lachnospiraceae bacterium]
MKNNILFKAVALTLAMSLSLVSPFASVKKTKADTIGMSLTPKTITTIGELTSGTGTVAEVTATKSGTIIPINVPANGTLYGTAITESAASSIYGYLYLDSTCTIKATSSYFYMYSSGLSDSLSLANSTAKTVYLKLSCNTNTAVRVSFGFVPGSITVGSKAKIFQNGYASSTSPIYHKFKLKKKKTVFIKGLTYSIGSSINTWGLYYDLCNSKKTPISDDYAYVSSTDVDSYVLDKGTYYIRTTTTSLAELSISTKKATNAKTSAKKAKVIKKGKKGWGSLSLTDKTSKKQVFKIKIKKKKKLVLNITNVYGNGSISYKITGPTRFLYGTTGSLSPGNSLTKKTYDKVNKGTYTITIKKSSKKMSSSFYVKCKC